MKRLPKRIFVCWDVDQDPDGVLLAFTSEKELVKIQCIEVGKTIHEGRYVLERELDITTQAVVMDLPARKGKTR